MRFEPLRLGLALCALAIGLAAAPAADARPRGNPGEMVARHAERLGLDAETQAALARIIEESRTRDEALREERRAAYARLREQLDAPEADRAAVLAEADAIAALKARAQRDRFEAILRIRELLTPEQRELLVAIRGEERPWRRGRGPLGGCSADLRELCADAPEGPEALRCLADRWDQVSEACRGAVARCRNGRPGAEKTPAP